MPKAKERAKKGKPEATKKTASKLLQTASKTVAKVAEKVVEAFSDKDKKGGKAPAAAANGKPAAKSAEKPVEKPAEKGAAKKGAPAKEPVGKVAAPVGKEAKKGKGKEDRKGSASATPPALRKDPTFLGPVPDKPMPRATKLSPPDEVLNKRDMELVLTAGAGRGVFGEGSLKGRLIVRDGFPYLHVIGRDKRELWFLLQGPDQEVLPAYVEHKVSVSGLIRKTTNYGGTVDVRKYAAKKPEELVVEAAPQEEKLKYLSPGEIEQISAAGMGAGMRGFGSLRGNVELMGEDYFLVVSHSGTRHQVSFMLDGKGVKGLKKSVGHTVQVSGVIEKSSGWGGKVEVEAFEPRLSEHKAVGRDGMDVTHIEGKESAILAELKLGQGLTVRLQERAGYTWAIEPTMAKRISLREANFEPSASGPHTREFFFTPRNLGVFEVEFFLAKALSPSQVSKTFKLTLTVKGA